MAILNQTKRIYLASAHHTCIEKARSRSMIIMAVFLFFYIIVGARVIDLCVIQSSAQRDLQGFEVAKHLEAGDRAQQYRGDIVDRNGVILARSLKTLSLYADPKMVESPTEVAKNISDLFPDVSYGALLQKLQSKKRFVWVKRDVTPEEQEKILQAGYPGLSFKQETQRVYPQDALTSHVVGTTGSEMQGLSGIEASFDGLLKDKSDELRLTIDVRLQHALRQEMLEVIERHKAKGGAGVIMDVNSGEVLSIVSLPDFNPYYYNEAGNSEVFNKATLGVYELGSTFKIFSTAALLEKSNGNISSVFDVRKPIESGRFKINDYHPEGRVLTTPEVFIHSSNIGSAMMAREVGTEGIKSFYQDLGLMDAPDFELQEVGRPIVPIPWRELNTLTASYGHGIAVSPLQLVSAASSIVNGGFLVKPTLVSHQDKVTGDKKVRVVSDKTAHRMRQMLRLVVSEGTGSKADVGGFLVGGKTGTAEKPGKKGYNRKSLISSFLGFFPMDKPKYSVFVMVDEPQGIKETYGYATGGWVGAPTVRGVIERMVSVLNLKPNETDSGFEGSLMRYVKTKEQLRKEKDIANH